MLHIDSLPADKGATFSIEEISLMRITMKTSSLSNCSDRLDAFYSFDFLYSVPQISIASIMGRMDSPKSERAYSTRGGTSG